MNPKLRIRSASFSEDELQAWRDGDYSLAKGCSRLLKRKLREKAKARPGRRFFGEAKVLASERPEDRRPFGRSDRAGQVLVFR